MFKKERDREQEREKRGRKRKREREGRLKELRGKSDSNSYQYIVNIFFEYSFLEIKHPFLLSKD